MNGVCAPQSGASLPNSDPPYFSMLDASFRDP